MKPVESLKVDVKHKSKSNLNLIVSLGELSGLNLFEHCIDYLLDDISKAGYSSINCIGMGLENSLIELELAEAKSIKFQKTNLAKLDELAVQGYVGVFKDIQFFLKLWKKWKVILDEVKEQQNKGQDCQILLIDYPGFNIKILKYAQKLGLKVSWLAPPQIWAWKSKRGKLLKGLDVGVLFEHEMSSLKKCGANPSLLGYPLFYPKGDAKIPYWNILDHEYSKKVLLVPGSREKVWREQLPVWIELCELLGLEYKVWMSNESQAELIERMYPPLCVSHNLKDALQDSKCALCRPGTASLELALTGIPMAGFSILSFWKTKFYKLMIKDKRLLLANLLVSKKAWEEVIFSDVKSASDWLKEWYHSEQVNQNHLENLKLLRTRSFGVNKDLGSRWKQWLNKL